MVKALSITLVELKDIEEVRTEIGWEITAFARDIVQIQLQIPDPDEVSQYGDIARLEVTFWDQENFKS